MHIFMDVIFGHDKATHEHLTLTVIELRALYTIAY